MVSWSTCAVWISVDSYLSGLTAAGVDEGSVWIFSDWFAIDNDGTVADNDSKGIVDDDLYKKKKLRKWNVSKAE